MGEPQPVNSLGQACVRPLPASPHIPGRDWRAPLGRPPISAPSGKTRDPRDQAHLLPQQETGPDCSLRGEEPQMGGGIPAPTSRRAGFTHPAPVPRSTCCRAWGWKCSVQCALHPPSQQHRHAGSTGAEAGWVGVAGRSVPATPQPPGPPPCLACNALAARSMGAPSGLCPPPTGPGGGGRLGPAVPPCGAAPGRAAGAGETPGPGGGCRDGPRPSGRSGRGAARAAGADPRPGDPRASLLTREGPRGAGQGGGGGGGGGAGRGRRRQQRQEQEPQP